MMTPLQDTAPNCRKVSNEVPLKLPQKAADSKSVNGSKGSHLISTTSLPKPSLPLVYARLVIAGW
jgi:hypothetical protein